MSQAQGGALGHDQDLAVLELEGAVLALGQHEAVGLAVHSLGTQGGGGEVDILALQGGVVERAVGGVGRDHQQLHDGVLLGHHAFATGAVVVSTHLLILHRIDIRTEAGADAVATVEDVELPADEGVVHGVHRGGDEGAAPVNRRAERLKVSHTQRREVVQPLQRIGELRDLLERNHLGQNVPLAHGLVAGLSLHDEFGLLALGLGSNSLCSRLLLNRSVGFFILLLGENRRAAVSSDFFLQLVGSSLDGHASAVEAERKKNILSLQTMESGSKFSFSHAVCVTKMKSAVHVWIRKGHHELFACGVALSFVNFVIIPFCLD